MEKQLCYLRLLFRFVLQTFYFLNLERSNFLVYILSQETLNQEARKIPTLLTRSFLNLAWLCPVSLKIVHLIKHCSIIGIAYNVCFTFSPCHSILIVQRLLFTDPPPTISLYHNVTASIGEMAILSCYVLGEIRYNLTWQHDGSALKEGRLWILPNSSLQIFNVEPGDAGRYQCTARNSHGTTTASVWLSVQGKYFGFEILMFVKLKDF